MTIVKKKSGTTYRTIMTECPFCGHYFGMDANGSDRSGHFEREHGPEVFDDDYEGDWTTKLDDWL